MTKRTTRAQIAQETLQILGKGWYQTPSGQKVFLKDKLDAALARSLHYTPKQLDKMLASSPPPQQEDSPRTVFEVVNETTLHAAHRLLHSGVAERVLALNFASARHPGGGFLNGSQAQEESLARASGLYPCIQQFPALYDINQRNPSCLYTDHTIYAPDVPVFRDDDDQLLEKPYLVSFVTMPAVNAGAVRRNEPNHVDKIEPVMVARMEKLLALAVHQQHNTLVLGAWGCGVFRNEPASVADWFARHLKDAGRFRQAFRCVAFAVLDHTKEQSNLQAFQQAFLD